MNKSKIIKEIANNLNSITGSLEALIKVLDNAAVTDEIKEKETSSITADSAANATKAEPITLEQVRAVLAAKSQAGKQPEVKALITKHGGQKLTDLNPSCYEELLKEAEVL